MAAKLATESTEGARTLIQTELPPASRARQSKGMQHILHETAVCNCEFWPSWLAVFHIRVSGHP